MYDAIGNWMKHHSWFVSRAFSVSILVAGLCFMIGAIKNWDSLYKANERDEIDLSLAQISRDWGRNTSRVYGFLLGIFIACCGVALCYVTFFKG